MDTVRQGFDDIRELQRYVDAQAGGPGKGFFQIVTDPYEARRVINEGRMAVVLEIEISELFDCRGCGDPTCDTRAGRPPARRAARPRRPLLAAAQQVRQPAHRRALRQRPDRRADQRRQPRRAPARSGAPRPARARWRDNEIFNAAGRGVQLDDSRAGQLGVQSGDACPPTRRAPHCNTRGLTDARPARRAAR